MSIFSSILRKIFPSSHPAVAASPAATTKPSTARPATASPAPAPAASTPAVDVEQVLSEMAKNKKESLNWRTSIVDLMKLLGLDSSQAARKSLAQELQYTGDMNDSASMNIWLHKQVMRKLAENGGKVPADLRT